MVKTNKFLKYWQGFLGGLRGQNRKQVSNREKAKKIAIWVLTVLILAMGLFIGSISNVQLFAQQLNTPFEELERKKPPKGLKLASILYEFAIAPNKEKFAKEHDIFLSEGKVRVFIFLDPASSSSERENLVKRHHIVVEKKSKDLLRALVPIEELMPLSKKPIIQSISLPDKPTIHGRYK